VLEIELNELSATFSEGRSIVLKIFQNSLSSSDMSLMSMAMFDSDSSELKDCTQLLTCFEYPCLDEKYLSQN